MAVLGDDTLEIYVDGSSLSKPRRGGVGIRFVGSARMGTQHIPT